MCTSVVVIIGDQLLMMFSKLHLYQFLVHETMKDVEIFCWKLQTLKRSV